MSLLIFHLVLSSFTFDGVDIAMASKDLKWNLKRYLNGMWPIHVDVDVALTASQVYSSPSVQGDSASSGLNPSKPFFLLHPSYGVVKTVSKPPSHIILGDRDCELEKFEATVCVELRT
jgi:hypothetical protein